MKTVRQHMNVTSAEVRRQGLDLARPANAQRPLLAQGESRAIVGLFVDDLRRLRRAAERLRLPANASDDEKREIKDAHYIACTILNALERVFATWGTGGRGKVPTFTWLKDAVYSLEKIAPRCGDAAPQFGTWEAPLTYAEATDASRRKAYARGRAALGGNVTDLATYRLYRRAFTR